MKTWAHLHPYNGIHEEHQHDKKSDVRKSLLAWKQEAQPFEPSFTPNTKRRTHITIKPMFSNFAMLRRNVLILISYFARATYNKFALASYQGPFEFCQIPVFIFLLLND